MPFKSENQRRYLWAKHPEIARRWSKKYGSKMATDGQVDTNDNVRGKMPPFMKGRKAPNEDARKMKSEAAKRRLAMMTQKKPKGK